MYLLLHSTGQSALGMTESLVAPNDAPPFTYSVVYSSLPERSGRREAKPLYHVRTRIFLRGNRISFSVI